MTRSQIGPRLKKARESAHLDQEEAARRAGIHPMTLSRWERGATSKIPAEKLAILAREYGIDQALLITTNYDELIENVSRGTSRVSENVVPRDHRIIITEFELEAEKSGAPDFFMDFARDALRNPDNVTARRYGHDGKLLSAEDQRLKTEQMIVKLRALLKAILADRLVDE